MIVVTVRMYGNLRRFLPDGQASALMELPQGATAETLLKALKADQEVWLLAVNGVVADRTTPLKSGDLVECYEPVAGG